MKEEKEIFIARETQQIAVYRLFIEVLQNVAIPVIKKRDGKNLTAGLATAMRDVMLKDHRFDLIAVRVSDSNELRIQVLGSLPRFRYANDTKGAYIMYDCSVDKIRFKEGFTVDAETTCSDIHRTIGSFYTKITTLQDCIQNYNKYEAQAVKIQALIEKYRVEVPLPMRKTISIER